MPLYLIERNFAQRVEEGSDEENAALFAMNDKFGIQWVYSFLSVDAKKSYCIYEGPSTAEIRDASKALELPVDTITEIDSRVNNDGKCVVLSMKDFDREREIRLRMEQELEQARNLQLGMLPDEPPDLQDADVGFYTRPATEVGGDFYDYFLSEHSTLTVALGDATGHGMQAGTIVAATKGLFQNLSSAAGVVEALSHMSEKLKNMSIGRNLMALAMVKIERNRLSYSSAGIPPMLLYRSQTKEVQEILLEGLPLGLTSSGNYRTHETELYPGDVVLLMTDGLPERLDPDSNEYGYSRPMSVFREIAHNSAERICKLMVDAGDKWADGREQEDDISVAVYKFLGDTSKN